MINKITLWFTFAQDEDKSQIAPWRIYRKVPKKSDYKKNDNMSLNPQNLTTKDFLKDNFCTIASPS